MPSIKKWWRKMRLAGRIGKVRKSRKQNPALSQEEKEKVPLPENWFDYWSVA